MLDLAAYRPVSAMLAITRDLSGLLRAHGFELVAEPESFLVTKKDRLQPDETTRAREWGAKLAASVTLV